MLAALLESIVFHVLSSPRGAETIFLPFYHRRATREQYFCISVLAASLRALKFLFSSLQNGDMCWNGRGGACVPARTSAQRRFHTKNTRIVRGDERWMRPCGATRAGTQAPPLPPPIKPLCHATFLVLLRRRSLFRQPLPMKHEK